MKPLTPRLDRRHCPLEPLEDRIAPATLFVTTNNDQGPGSLRQAILDANSAAFPGPDAISFAPITGGGPFVISLLTPLPAVTEPLTIDGYTAPGTAENTAAIGTNAVLRVMIDGSKLNSASGLVLGSDADSDASGSVIRGLAIAGFHPAINGAGYGILIQADNVTVAGNFIGTDLSGSAVFSGVDGSGLTVTGNGNAAVGIDLLFGIDSYTGNVIGGLALKDRNILSGGAFGVQLGGDAKATLVQGNLIGTDRTGAVAIPNVTGGIAIAGDDNTIGGTTGGAGNVISGNAGPGIRVGSNVNTVIQGNIIGLTAAATAPLGNGNSGIILQYDTTNVTIGGTVASAANVISANAGAGIEIGSRVGDGAAHAVTVRGNAIGTDKTGTIAFGNAGPGIGVFGTSGALIGGTAVNERNTVAFNAAGVVLDGSFSGLPIAGVHISGDGIHDNAGLGIDLVGGAQDFFGVTKNDALDGDTGPNGLTNAPVLSGFSNPGGTVTISGALAARPGAQYIVEYFALAPSQVDASGSGESGLFLGSQTVTTDAAGNVALNFSQAISLPADSYFSATATEIAASQTSEFSNVVGPARTFTWVGGSATAPNDWFTAANWNSAQGAGVPGPLDTAIFGGGPDIVFTGGSASVAAFQHTGGTVSGAGSVTVRQTLAWNSGAQSGPDLVLNAGATGTINNAGGASWAGGTLDVFGALTLSGGIFTFNAGNFIVESSGSLALSTGVRDGDGSATPSVFSNLGTTTKLTTGGFGIQSFAGVTNSGLMLASQGTFVVDALTQTGGELRLAGGNVVGAGTLTLDGGALTGTGTIGQSVLNNAATIDPGGPGAAATIGIGGSYTQGAAGTLAVELGGVAAGQFDVLAITGTTSLDGTLAIANLAGFTPANGDVFRVVQAANNPGSFSALAGATAGLTQTPDASGLVLSSSALIFTWDNSAGDGDWFNPLNWDRDSGVPGAADIAVLNTASTITLGGLASVGTFQQSAGVFTGAGTLTILGSFDWSGGSQAGAGATILAAGSTALLHTAGAKSIDGRAITNSGALTWQDTGGIHLNAGSFTNAGGGLFLVTNSAALDDVNGNATGSIGSFTNAGTLRKTGSTGMSTWSMFGAFSNTGTVDVQSGAMTFDAGASSTHTGTFTTAAGTTIGFSGSHVLDAGGALAGAGNYTLGTIFSWLGGAISTTGTTTVNGALSLSGSADKHLDNGTLVGSGGIDFGGTGQFALGGSTVNIDNGFTLLSDATISITSGAPVFNISSTGYIAKGVSTGTSTFSLGIAVNSQGAINALKGTIDLGNAFTQTGGFTVLNGGGIAGTLTFAGGQLYGSGAISGSVNNTGAIVRPGGVNIAGTLTINGSYTQGAGGTLEVEVGDGLAGGVNDTLAVNGTASLGGTISEPQSGNLTGTSYTVITYAGAAGDFSTFNLTPPLLASRQAAAYALVTPPPPNPLVVNTELDVVSAFDAFTSLREAITYANGNAGTDTITFAIPGTGAHTLTLASALPGITDAVVIDGNSQPGASANTQAIGTNAVLLVQLAYGGSSVSFSGLTLAAGSGGSTVRGLVVSGFAGLGSSGIEIQSNGNTIEGCFIGTTSTGAAASGNDAGIHISSASNNTIGGSTLAARNVISGNTGNGVLIDGASASTIVRGNVIGLAADGTSALGNLGWGIALGNGSTATSIGGLGPTDGNVISSNSIGIFSNADGTTIQGNRIGTTHAGDFARGNGTGLYLIGEAGPTISGNVIAASGSYGAYLEGTSGGTVSGNFIGTNAAGTAALANDTGLTITNSSTNNTVTGNVISGNTNEGLVIEIDGSTSNVIAGNFIGTNAAGASLPNATGIRVGFGGNTIGGLSGTDANVIAFNTGNGVQVEGFGTVGVKILGNVFRGNGALAIDLGNDGPTANDATDSDTGQNNLINFPVLTGATLNSGNAVVDGAVTTATTGSVRIEFFLASTGAFVGAQDVATVAGTSATFTATLPGVSAGEQIVATTSDTAVEGTSEFSAPVVVIPPALVSIGDAAIVEGNGGVKQLVFKVTLDQAVPAAVTVNFNTLAFSADARSATAGVDYAPSGGSATFAPGALSQTISIPIVGDTATEGVERFKVVLSNPTNAGLGDAEGVGAILDDDHHTFAAGEGSGSKFSVFTTTASGATLAQTIQAFAPSYKGGVRVAVGDVNGDGVDDVVAGAGLGGRAKVRVFDGANNFQPMAGVLGDFAAFGKSYRGGVFVAAGDVDGDGRAEVIVTPSAGSSNRVNIFSGADGSLLSSFRAFGKGAGGVRVAAGDVDGDGRADIIVGSGVGSSVRVFDGLSGTALTGAEHEFRAFGRNYRGGVFVAAGDVNGDGVADIITGAGAGAPHVRVFLQGVGGVAPASFDAYAGSALRGVHVSAFDIDGDGIADILTSKGRKGDGAVRVFNGANAALLFETRAFSTQPDGVYIG